MFGRKARRPTTIQTLIGENTHIEGDIRFDSGCHVDGFINGSVVAVNDVDAYLSISENGCVQGSVNVPRLGLSGTVEGDVVVTEMAELGATARVTGDVYYNLIEIAAGAEINGKLIHQAARDTAKAVPVAYSKSGTEEAAELEGAAEQTS
jgi:cytoskeletal protein CcmA (bactofilin family)